MAVPAQSPLSDIEIARLRIINYPDPRLQTPGESIEHGNPPVARVAARMIELMRAAHGIGLAAPQVGLSWRLFVCNPSGEPHDDQVYLNPRLTNLEGSLDGEEGCLSIPDVTGVIRRAARVTLVATNLNGRPVERSAEGLVARCWQHEVDHLDGRLILDRMSPADKLAARRVLRQLETAYRRGQAASRP